MSLSSSRLNPVTMTLCMEGDEAVHVGDMLLGDMIPENVALRYVVFPRFHPQRRFVSRRARMAMTFLWIPDEQD